MTYKNLMIVSSVFGGLAVLIGAFGAHGLQKYLSIKELGVYETAVKYHFFHVFATFCYLSWAKDKSCQLFPAVFFLFGIIIFSGSLYLLALLHTPKLGMITPIGGFLMILGWFFFAWQIRKYEVNR